MLPWYEVLLSHSVMCVGVCVYKLVPNPLQVYSYHYDLCLTRVVVCSCSRTWTACKKWNKFSQAGAKGEEFWIHSYNYGLPCYSTACWLLDYVVNVVNWNFNSVIGLWWASLVSTLSKLIQQSIFPVEPAKLLLFLVQWGIVQGHSSIIMAHLCPQHSYCSRR